ncbi:MAG: type II toxin-antitoxin system PemK/MazF family toxin [Chitinophagales bacterium]|nr:type II toxin-antitoxin system PemK/MazF family toxin [Chitinophagales bacterium]
MSYFNLEKKIEFLRKWFEKKEKLAIRYFENQIEKSKPYVKAGDIYHADLGVNIYDEIDRFCPVLIFQGNDYYLRNSNVVFVIPISSNTQSKPYRVNFNDYDLTISEGLSEGTILIQQARPISKTRLLDFRGRLSEKKMLEIGDMFIEFITKNTPHI